MDGFSKKNDCRVTLQEVHRALEDWEIRKRINQKIDIWGLRYSPKKIAAVPIGFLSTAILYYFLNRLRGSSLDYSQAALMTLGYRLKCQYTALTLTHFKRTSFFEYSLVILAKLTHYFATSRFPELAEAMGESEIENDLYRSIVNLLIGYQVDSKAYELIENKFKIKRYKSQDKRDSLQVMNDIKFAFEPVEKAKVSTKKLHRNGIKNLLQVHQAEKNLETFRFEVHEALHIKKGGDRNENKSPPRKKVEESPSSADKVGWLKGKNKLLNINQVSAAMTVYMGSGPHNKAISNIHLSKRKQLKQFYFQTVKEEHELGVPPPLGEVSINATKCKDWSLIVGSLKQKSDHSPAKEGIHLKNCNLSHKHQSSMGFGPHFNKLSLEVTDQSIDQYDVDFRRLKNTEDDSILCVNGDMKTKKEILRKSNSIFFVRDRSQFQKSCVKRKEIFENGSIVLPRLEKS